MLFGKCEKCGRKTEKTVIKTKRSKIWKVYCMECQQYLYPASKDLIAEAKKYIEFNHKLNF